MKRNQLSFILRMLAPKRVSLFSIVLLFSVAVMAQDQYKVTTQKLNVRSNPTTTSTVVGSLSNGAKVSVYSIKNGWATIDYKGTKRYVKSEFLSPTSEKQASKKRDESQRPAPPRSVSSQTSSPQRTPAQSPAQYGRQNYYGWNASLELQPVFGLDKGIDPEIELLFGLTKGLNEFASIGGAVGVCSNYHFDQAPSIPLTVRTIFEGKRLKVSPYGMFDAGFRFNLEDFDYSSIIINPTVGIRLSSIYLGVGYMALIPTKSGLPTTNLLNLKLGYVFGRNDGDRIKRFFSHVHPSLEIGGSYYLENMGATDTQYEIASQLIADMKFALNYRINDNWSVGIGTGADVDFASVDIVMPFYLRGKYHFLESSAAVRPFLQLDAGFRAKIVDGEDNIQGGAFIEPAVGAQFGKFYITAGLTSYHNNEPYGYGGSYEKKAYKAINAMLGVEF